MMVEGLDAVAAVPEAALDGPLAVLEATSPAGGEAHILAANGFFAALLGLLPQDAVGRALGELSEAGAAAPALIRLLDERLIGGHPGPWTIDLGSLALRCEVLPTGGDARLVVVTGGRGASALFDPRLRPLFDRAGIGLAVLSPEGRIAAINPAFADLLGMAAESIVGQPLRRFLHPEEIDGAEDEQRALADGRRTTWHGERRLFGQNGTELWTRMTLAAIEAQSGRPAALVALVEDIGPVQRAERKIRYLSAYDPTTGLPRAELFEQRAATVLAQAKGHRAALLVIGFERLPALLLGMERQSAEQLVRALVERLRGTLAPADMLGRLGDAHFAVMLAPGESADRPRDALAAVREVIASFAAPLPGVEGDVVLTPTVGLGIFPDHGSMARELIRAAGAALEQAREVDAPPFRVFEPAMAGVAMARLTLETRLHRAIEERRLGLVYQPKVEADGTRLAGFEALVRWTEEGRTVSPAEFIPLAEETGLILPLGQLVLETACRQFASWREAGVLDVPVAVNLSGRQIADSEFVNVVRDTLRRTGLPANRLKFELTETVLFRSTGGDRQVLEHLHEAGIGLLLDDFGTGYSSLSYLKRFPIEGIKIDRSFVQGMVEDPDAASIVQAIINMAHALKMHVVAEGVETQEQMLFLKAYRCDWMQGYLFSKPLSPDEVEAFAQARL